MYGKKIACIKDSFFTTQKKNKNNVWKLESIILNKFAFKKIQNLKSNNIRIIYYIQVGT